MCDLHIDLSVVIVSYNVRDLLAACLDSIKDSQPAVSYEIWVVENNSQDGSLEMLTGHYPQVKLMINRDNLGFASANNMAIPHCRGRYFLFLNPDTLVLEGAFDRLVDFLDDRTEAGAAGSLLYNPDRTLQPSCFPFPTLGREFWRLLHLDRLWPRALYPMDRWDVHQSRQVDVLQGTSLAVRREAIDQVGPFDDAFFMYSEEVDLCYRLNQAGWQLFWVPASKIVHYGGQSTRQTAASMFLQLYRGKTQYFRKHHGSFTAFGYKVILTLAGIVRILVSPLALLEKGERREEHLRLAGYYRSLLRALAEF